MPICGHLRVTRDLSRRVLCHHKLARTGQFRRIHIDENRIYQVDYLQVRRDRGVGGKAKAKSIISLNWRAQTCPPSKHVLSLTSNDRFEAPARRLKRIFFRNGQRAVTFQYEPQAGGRAIFDGVLQPLARTWAYLAGIGKQDVKRHDWLPMATD
jgi:hypothetical protein